MTTHIECLIEEPSAEAALENLAPRLLGEGTTFRFHVFQGKSDLLAKLPARLRGYRAWLPADWRIVVLVDADSADCRVLKARLDDAAQAAGLITPATVRPGQRVQVLNRIAIEELEAWFFGDVAALRQVCPRISSNLHHQARYRDPDAIPGGTWETLERLLVRLGYLKGGLPKISFARDVSQHMDPDQNRSHSFQVFVSGINRLLGEMTQAE